MHGIGAVLVAGQAATDDIEAGTLCGDDPAGHKLPMSHDMSVSQTEETMNDELRWIRAQMDLTLGKMVFAYSCQCWNEHETAAQKAALEHGARELHRLSLLETTVLERLGLL